MIKRIISLAQTPEGISTFSNIMSSGFGLLSFFFITRAFSPNALGQWFIFLSGATLVDMLRIGLVNKGFIYLYSGKEGAGKSVVIGSGLALFSAFSAGVALLLFASTIILPSITDPNSSWRMFFVWYPIFAVMSIPHNVSEWIAQAELRFHRSVVTRIIVRGGFLLFTAINFFHHLFSIDELAMIFIALNAVSSLLTVALSWTPLSSLRSIRIDSLKQLLQFGKFNSITQVGSNLLRSSDSFLLGSFLGPIAVARYGVPAKLLEIVELPLRCFGAAAYPEFARAHHAGNIEEMKRSFVKTVFRLTLFVLPIVILCAVFAQQVTMLFGGAQYRNTATILRFFLAYCLLIPFDRFSGIFIDSLNKPHYNAVKVWLMLGVNCLSDIIALYFFGTVESVAAASLVTFFFGTVVNIVMIKSLTGWNPVSKESFTHSVRQLAVSVNGFSR